MVVSTESVFDLADVDPSEVFLKRYEDAVVYGDRQGETVLHEGAVTVLGNGWVKLPTDRLLSPDAVHHIDPVPDDT